jgi:EPS-associated MarR family transcriptional regulator
MSENLELRALRRLSVKPEISQRELSVDLGSSLGRTNYVLRSLLRQGLLKIQRFKNSKNKRAYSYLLTPKGWARKAALTRSFLAAKLSEYESLRLEIDALRSEVDTPDHTRADTSLGDGPQPNGGSSLK